MLDLPWSAITGLVVLAGYQLGGWSLALLTGSLTLFLAVTGNREKSMISIYLCGISVLIDTLQTLPSFLYLFPVVMLFRVGDFSAMIADRLINAWSYRKKRELGIL